MSLSTDRFSPDLLHLVLKRLDTADMLIARRVCKQWLEIIDEHKSFWRILHLPEGSQECGSSIVDLFDRKSKSSIKKVSINWKGKAPTNTEHLSNTLGKQRRTLSSFRLDCVADNFEMLKFGVLVLLCPDMRKFIVWNSTQDDIPAVFLINKELHLKTRGLQILWKSLLSSLDIELLANLTSLSIVSPNTSTQWREILTKPSKNLKHLNIRFGWDWRGEDLDPLEFPRLEVLELYSGIDFPNWIRISYTSTLMVYHHEVLRGLPSVSHLWLSGFEKCGRLTTSCPSLKTLRVASKSSSINSATFLLDQRRSMAESSMEIDGSKVTPIKTLLVDFNRFSEEELASLGSFVEEVIDLETAPKQIEVEI